MKEIIKSGLNGVIFNEKIEGIIVLSMHMVLSNDKSTLNKALICNNLLNDTLNKFFSYTKIHVLKFVTKMIFWSAETFSDMILMITL